MSIKFEYLGNMRASLVAIAVFAANGAKNIDEAWNVIYALRDEDSREICDKGYFIELPD